MTDAEIARSHGRHEALSWHRDRAERTRSAAATTGANGDSGSTAYWLALAAWHDTQAEGYVRALRQEAAADAA